MKRRLFLQRLVQVVAAVTVTPVALAKVLEVVPKPSQQAIDLQQFQDILYDLMRKRRDAGTHGTIDFFTDSKTAKILQQRWAELSELT